MGAPDPKPPLDPLQQHVADELHAFTQTPILFIASVLLVGGLIWLALKALMDARYQGRIDTLNERLQFKDDQIRALQDTAVQAARMDAARDAGSEQVVEETPVVVETEAPADDGGPNMPIRDVFFYVDPDVLNEDQKAWQKVGADVADALSVGRLQAWGRQIGRGSSLSRDRSRLVAIDQSAWASGDFTYWFLAEGHERMTHFIAKEPGGLGGSTEWADIQFNRAQVQKLWPRA